MFVGMANDSPLCTADTYYGAFEGTRDIARKIGWLDPHVQVMARIWVEEVPHVGDLE
jgi:hypothetical protein